VQTDSWLYPNDIVEYLWDFGDGNTSTEENPKHFYKQPGEYEVTLQYKTAQGCTGSLKAHRKVPIIGIPKATLELEGGGLICGNNPVLLTLKSDSFIDFKYLEIFPPAAYEFVSEPWYDRNTQFQVKFYNSGTFSGIVKYGAGGCYDTIYLNDFFKVNPPFLYKIEGFNTCNGDRLTYRFTDSSKDATKWIWDFGDGTIKEFTTKQDTVYHSYEKSGWYDAKLTVYNGSCSISDSLNFAVSEKPNNLTLKDYDWDSDCYNLAIPVEISGYEDRPNLITRACPMRL
jgi:hypothetical protein